MSDFEDKIKALPKPKTLEEQYLYALVCSVAGVDYSEPFHSPFWRMEQYWKAFFEVTSKRILDPLTLDETAIIADGIVNERILSDTVKDRLLGYANIEESMLTNEVKNKLLGEQRIVTSMLADEIVSRLLGANKVGYSMLDSDLKRRLADIEDAISNNIDRITALENK